MEPNWADAQTAEDVGKLLQSKYPNLDIRGFNDRHNPDIRAVQEFAEAIDDMLTKYPQVAVTTVSITKPPPGMADAWAWATPRPTGKGYMSAAISLNADMATDWLVSCDSISFTCNSLLGWS